MAGGDEDDVDRVAVGALEPVTLELSVSLHVADDRFDSTSPSEFALDGRGSDAAGIGEIDLRGGQSVTAIASVDIGPLDRGAGEALNLGDLALQRMAVIGQARAGLGADDELSTSGACSA